MSEFVDPGSEIFLSYASKDIERVRPLVQALETLQWSVFWDREIPPGDVRGTWQFREPQVVRLAETPEITD